MATPDRRDGEDARRADDGPRWRVEGARDPKHEGKGKSTSSRFRIPGSRRFWILVAILLLINWWLASQIREPEPKLSVPYSVFRQEVQQGNVSSIVTRGGEIEGTFKKAVRYPAGSTAPADKEFVTERPSITDDGLLPLLVRENVKVEAQAPAGSNIVTTILVSFGPTLLFIFLFFFILRRLGAGGGGFSGMGRSKARRYEPTMQRTTFADVAGIEEAEEQLVEIVDFLRSPEKYSRLGGAIPSGVLLSGPPGTGKTLLARALAGEAGVPFFSMSASEFVEMVVGVGASRVRDLFEQAKAEAPAIVFIDELDAVGRARGGSNQFAGHDEREQTLNQILTEMDGFSGTEGVIVIASTNRPEILDTALLRPGRFDRHVVVNPPDQRGRRAILGVHTRDVPLADDVDLDQLASTTPGMVGADLRNVINESALLAARRDHERVTKADVSDALEKVILGAARRLMLSRADKERTAYHESGHALLGMLLPGSDPVRKVSIVPRGGALGITLQTPESDRYGYTADFLVNRITTALGGRAAEELVYGHYTTGAEADLQYVTRLARSMVGRWGMSEAIGPLAVLPPSGAEGFVAAGDLLADETRQLFDAEVRRIVDESYQHAMTLLRQHRPQLDALVAGLLEAETLDEAEAYSIAGIQRPRTADNGTAAAAVAEILDEPALTAEPDET